MAEDIEPKPADPYKTNRLIQAMRDRAGIESETVKALLYINGGAAALMVPVIGQTLLSGKAELRILVSTMAASLVCWAFGVVCAVLSNQVRVFVSLGYSAEERDEHRWERAWRPCLETFSYIVRIASGVSFVFGAVILLNGFVMAGF